MPTRIVLGGPRCKRGVPRGAELGGALARALRGISYRGTNTTVRRALALLRGTRPRVAAAPDVAAPRRAPELIWVTCAAMYAAGSPVSVAFSGAEIPARALVALGCATQVPRGRRVSGAALSASTRLVPRLAQKVTLVTGADQGIGAAIARAFVAEGATVLVTDVRDDVGAALAAALGPTARYRRLDVRREDDWAAATASALDAFGRLDVVVNNAGITGFEDGPVAHDPEHATLDVWHAVLATNLDGVFLGCQHAIRAMRRNVAPATGAGSIVNISSRSGIVGIPLAAAYAASKAAVRNHTKSVALYCAQQGLAIRCNSVHPAAILTPMWDAMLGDGPGRAGREAAFVRDTPLQRFGTPDEVAHAVVYLASDESAYTTGAELTIDGGLLAGSAASPGAAED